jgi:hypothetical protein
MPSIIGPWGDRYKLTRAVDPRLNLVAIKAQDVRAQTPAAGELPAAMPAEHGLDRQVEQLGDVAGSQEAIAHAGANLRR